MRDSGQSSAAGREPDGPGRMPRTRDGVGTKGAEQLMMAGGLLVAEERDCRASPTRPWADFICRVMSVIVVGPQREATRAWRVNWGGVSG